VAMVSVGIGEIISMNDQNINISDMFDLACAFENAGEINFVEGRIKNRSRYQNVAGFVNIAFACELFLKLLLVSVEYDNREHKLADLWETLVISHQDITDDVRSGVMNDLSSDMTFEEMLSDDSDVFYNFRYFYEPTRMEAIRNNPLRPQFLLYLCIHLRTCPKDSF